MSSTWRLLVEQMSADLNDRRNKERKLLESKKPGTIYVADSREMKIVAHSLFGKAVAPLLRDSSSIGISNAARLAEDKLIELTKLHATAAAKAAMGALVSIRVKGEGLIIGIDPHTKKQRLPENRWEQIRNLIEVFKGEGKLTGAAYILIDHKQIQEMQREIVDDLFKWATSSTNELFKQPTERTAIEGKETTLNRTFYLLNPQGKKGAQRIIQGGHGAGLGVSVSQVTTGRFLRQLGLRALDAGDTTLAGEANLLYKQLNAAFNNSKIIATQTELDKLSTSVLDEIGLKGIHTHFYDDSGNHKENFVTIVSFQSSGNNNFDSARELALTKLLRNWLLKNFVKTYDASKPYSPPLTDRILSILTYTIGKNLKKARVKGPVKAQAVIKGKTEAKGDSKLRITQRLNVEKFDIKVRKSNQTFRDKKEPAKNSLNVIQMLAYINSRLPGTIRSNMGAPRLENRTGRFSESVIATDVQSTAQGYPSVGYTYRKAPYQVFEIGAGRRPWATPDRDPRSLIDKSIREIAAELFVSRLYTRRI